MPNIEEQQLVYRVSEHQDDKAFGELYQAYRDKLYKFIVLRTSRHEDAEDLTAEIFKNLWVYLTNPRNKKVENFRAFIYRSARNAIANFYRARGRMPETVELDDPDEYTELADENEDIFKNQVNAQDIDKLMECIQKLPEAYREVIALRFFEELDIKEIADILGKTLGNTRVLIHRGKIALRKMTESGLSPDGKGLSPAQYGQDR